MQKLTTEQALELTMDYINNYEELIQKRNICIGEIDKKSEETIQLFERILTERHGC